MVYLSRTILRNVSCHQFLHSFLHSFLQQHFLPEHFFCSALFGEQKKVASLRVRFAQLWFAP